MDMVFSACGIVLGLVASGGGLYFYATEDETDDLTKAINMIVAGAGAIVGVASFIYFLVHLT